MNVTDAALVVEVAARLKAIKPNAPKVLYPGQYFEPIVEQDKIQALLNSPKSACDAQGSITLNVIALGLARLQAQGAYDVLTKLLQDIDAKYKEKASLKDPKNDDERKKQDQRKAELTLEILKAAINLPGASVDTAKVIAASLKANMDATDAFMKVLGTPDSKGNTALGRLATAQTLDNELTKEGAKTNVLVLKWLRGGAINKTRKNLLSWLA